METNALVGKGVDGVNYTKVVENDKLTNKDFLKLMLEELKRQDPTKPMNSKEMINSHMQMSAINTNQETIKAMKAMSEAFKQSSLANATSLIGKNIENGELGDNGVTRAFKVRSIENIEGEVNLKVQELDHMKYLLSVDKKILNYNADGELIDSEGKKTGNKVLLESPGVPKLKKGKLQILDKDNKAIDSSKYEVSSSPVAVYKQKVVAIPLSKVTKVF